MKHFYFSFEHIPISDARRFLIEHRDGLRTAAIVGIVLVGFILSLFGNEVLR